MILRAIAVALYLLAFTTCGAMQQAASPSPSPAAFRISGTLVDAKTGQPLAGARVAIAPVTDRNNFTTVVTGDDGNFSFSGLSAGKYTLTAQARGYLLRSFNQHDGFSSSIVVGPDLDSDGLLFRLPAESAIAGVVTDEAGEGVRGAQVALYLIGVSAGVAAARIRGSTTTDDDGVYHFAHLLPGRYIVAVIARPWYAGYANAYTITSVSASNGVDASVISEVTRNAALDVAYPVTFYGGETDAAQATPIVLGSGDRAQADVTLQPVPALHMRLDRGQGDQQSYVSLEKRILDGPPVFIPTEVRGNGTDREIVGIAPGRYQVKTYIPGNDSDNGNEVREIEFTASGEFDRNQGNAYVQFSATVLADPGSLSGQATVQLLNKKTRETVSGRVGDDGEVAFKPGVPPGSYEVSLSSASGIYLKSIAASGAEVSGRTIEIRSGSNVKMTVATARGQGKITGAAMRDGQPVAGAMVVLVPADPAHNQVLFRRDQSDTDGTFTLATVVPGKYTLLAIDNGWDLEWMNPDVVRNYLGRGVAVDVRENGKYELKVTVQ